MGFRSSFSQNNEIKKFGIANVAPDKLKNSDGKDPEQFLIFYHKRGNAHKSLRFIADFKNEKLSGSTEVAPPGVKPFPSKEDAIAVTIGQ